MAIHESKIPETFQSIKSKMNGKIRFVVEQMNEALDEICTSKEYTAKDKLKATQEYLSVFLRLENEIQKELEHKEVIKNRRLTNKIKQIEVSELEDNQFTDSIKPINQSKFSPTMSGNFS